MITVNARGDQCPIPAVKAKKIVSAFTGPKTVIVPVDNDVAVQNGSYLASDITRP